MKVNEKSTTIIGCVPCLVAYCNRVVVVRLVPVGNRFKKRRAYALCVFNYLAQALSPLMDQRTRLNTGRIQFKVLTTLPTSMHSSRMRTFRSAMAATRCLYQRV